KRISSWVSKSRRCLSTAGFCTSRYDRSWSWVEYSTTLALASKLWWWPVSLWATTLPDTRLAVRGVRGLAPDLLREDAARRPPGGRGVGGCESGGYLVWIGSGWIPARDPRPRQVVRVTTPSVGCS